MGKSSRRQSKGLGTHNAARFVCGHCPGVKFGLHDDWNEARRDWELHNHTWHAAHRHGIARNNRRLRNISANGWQTIEGVMPIPAIVKAFL